MSTLPTPLTDWLTTHLGWPAAIFLVLAVVTVAGIGLAHCWRRTGRGLDEALEPEYDSWVRGPMHIEAEELTDEEARVVALIAESVRARRQAAVDAEGWLSGRKGTAL